LTDVRVARPPEKLSENPVRVVTRWRLDKLKDVRARVKVRNSVCLLEIDMVTPLLHQTTTKKFSIKRKATNKRQYKTDTLHNNASFEHPLEGPSA
jgi:hypothetical protein